MNCANGRMPEKPAVRHVLGIVGATPLGMHLAIESVRRGDQAVLRETDPARLGLATLKLMEMLNGEIKTGRLQSTAAKAMLGRIRGTSTWKHFDEIDLAVDTRAKGDGSDIASAAPKSALLVTTSLGGRLADERSFGIRVAEPFGSSAAVELRHGTADPDSVRTVRAWLGSLGWVPIVVADRPGMLLSRMWLAGWNEAVLLIREGARPERIEQALSRFGFGPNFLRSLDRIGIDRIAGMIRLLAPEMERIPFDPVWQEMTERGWTGEAAKKGFYRYGRGRPRRSTSFSSTRFRRAAARPCRMPSGTGRSASASFCLMVNEAYRALDEGAIATGDELDLAMMLTDWAPHRGGPIRFAECEGAGTIVAGLRSLEPLGPRYVPAASLVAKAESANRPRFSSRIFLDPNSLAATLRTSRQPSSPRGELPMSTPEKRIQELNLQLPTPAKPMAKYKPTVLIGNTLYVSGHGPAKVDAKHPVMLGRVGTKLTRDQGKESARLVGINILATVRAALGSLDKVERLVKSLGMVNSSPDFHDHPFVINGFSELMAEVFGEDAGVGPVAPSAWCALPGDIPVEIEAIFEVKP